MIKILKYVYLSISSASYRVMLPVFFLLYKIYLGKHFDTNIFPCVDQ